MNTSGKGLPAGFGGTVRSWLDLLPPAERALRLPRAGAEGEGPYDRIEIAALTESMGRIEDLLAQLAPRLTEDGILVLETENPQSPRHVRRVLEGRTPVHEPFGSIEDPSQCPPLRRVLAAAAAAGLRVVDCIRVPSRPGSLPEDFARTMSAADLLPTAFLHGPPPERFWLTCRRQGRLAGSVLIGAGPEEARRTTEQAVRAFLPQDWEIVRGDGSSEPVSFNRAVAAAKGELVWCLRAGAVPDRQLFESSLAACVSGSAVPGENGERRHPGDGSGLMLPRTDVLTVGPLSEHWQNDAVAWEDWNMALECQLRAPQPVSGRFTNPPPPVAAPQVFAAESERMLATWLPLVEASDPEVDEHASQKASYPHAPPPWQGRRPRITLCMIAKDEEDFLDECLTRARPAVDEIVLVDTGSTDRTVEIAESHGANVLHRAWDDDFSAPRNLALEHATGDWVLVLDADEFLTDEAPARIRALAEDGRVAGYHMRFTNVYTGGKTIGILMVRLFRNLPGLRYRNVVHEQVTPSLMLAARPLGLSIANADVEVLHYGYRDDVMDDRGKNERNERLFRAQLERHPDDVYSLYKYGDFLRRVPGRQRDACEILERCLRCILAEPPAGARELPYAGEVAALCALEHSRAGDQERAREIVDLAFRRFLPTPNLHYIAASLDLAEGRCDAAIEHYRRCMAYGGQVMVVPIQEGITSYVALTGMAQAWMQKGDNRRARALLERAIAEKPDHDVSHLALSKLFLLEGDPAAALQVLTDYLARHPECAGACQQATLILQRLGLTDEARRMGEAALDLLERDARENDAEHMKSILGAL